MNRRQFLQASGSVALGAALCEAADEKPLAAPERFALSSEPVLVNSAPDGVTVLCPISGPGTGWVEYGPGENLGMRADGEVGGLLPYSDRLLSFRITGLKAAEKYFYRVHACPIDFAPSKRITRGGEIQSAVFSFRTINPAAPSCSFTVWNDTHENRDTIDALVNSLSKEPTDILIWNGDVTNDLLDENRIVEQFIAPAGQKGFASSVPLFLGRGNHDVRGKFARKLPQYVNGPQGEYFYTFRVGPVAGIVLDTGEDKPDDVGLYAGLNGFAEYRSRQREWLAKAIQAEEIRSARFKVAFLHIPLVWEKEIPVHWPGVWGEGIKGWICEDGLSKWGDLLAKAGVSVVISGHTHQHAWFPANQTRPWGQLIGGGPQPLRATSIIARADQKRMEIVLRNLAGEVMWREEFLPKV